MMKKRLWSMFCALVLLFTLIPATAFAEPALVASVQIKSHIICGGSITDPTLVSTGCSIDSKSVVWDGDTSEPKSNLIGTGFAEAGEKYTMTVVLAPDGEDYFDPAQTVVNMDGKPLDSTALALDGDGKLVVTYHFEPHYKVELNKEGVGNASVDKTEADPGETVKISIEITDDCWELDTITGKYGIGDSQTLSIDMDNLSFQMPSDPGSNVKIFVKFKQTKCRLYFVMNGHGEQPPTLEVTTGETATAVTPSNPPGWTFVNWYGDDPTCTEGNEFDFTKSITEDHKLYAKWEKDTAVTEEYPIWIGGNQLNDTYPKDGSGNLDVFDDGTILYTPASGGTQAKLALNNAKILSTILDPIEGYAIVALEDISVNLSGDNQIGETQSDITSGSGFTIAIGIKAGNFKSDTTNYDVTLTGDGSLTIYDKLRGIDAGSIAIGIGGTLKVREYGDSDAACCLKAEDGSVTLNSGTLDLESHLSNGVAGALTVNGGTLEAYAHNTGGDATLNALDTEPTIPKDYEIIGGEDKDSATAITTAEATSKKYVKIAKAASEYTVHFETNGGSLILSVQVKEGDTVSQPADPTREGYDFKGWYSDKELKTPYAFSTPVQGEFTLYADWAKKQYTVSFDSKGGSEVASQTIAYGDKAVEPKNPTRKGYKFGGWYTDKNCKGNKYSFDTPVKQDTQLYAKWTSKDGSKDADSKKAKTGDTSNVKVWIIVAVVAVVILAILAIILSRKKRD